MVRTQPRETAVETDVVWKAEVCSQHTNLELQEERSMRERGFFGKEVAEFEELLHGARPQTQEDQQTTGKILQINVRSRVSRVSREDSIIRRTEKCLNLPSSLWLSVSSGMTREAYVVRNIRLHHGGKQLVETCMDAGGRAPNWQLTLPVVDSCFSLLAFDLYHPYAVSCVISEVWPLAFFFFFLQSNLLLFGRQEVDSRFVFSSFLCELRNLAWRHMARQHVSMLWEKAVGSQVCRGLMVKAARATLLIAPFISPSNH